MIEVKLAINVHRNYCWSRWVVELALVSERTIASEVTTAVWDILRALCGSLRGRLWLGGGSITEEWIAAVKVVAEMMSCS